MIAIRDSLTDRSGRHCNGWDLLRVAIVEQAVSDYRDALDGIVPPYAGNETPFCSVAALEAFFLSDWGEWLCGRNMEGPMEIIKKQVRRSRRK